MRTTLLSLLFLSACGTTVTEVLEATEPTSRALWAPDCRPYPLAVSVGAPQEAAARAELATLSPGATMTWSAVRNTPANIFGAAFELECEPGKNARELWLAFAGAHPALFRIDPSEWQSAPAPCESVPAAAEWVNTTRATYAGLPARADTLAWRWRSTGKRVVVEAVAGSWLPPAEYNDRLALSRCADLDVAAAEKTARSTRLAYRTFDFCTPTGDFTYVAAPADAFEGGKSALLEVSELSGKVLVRKVSDTRLVLAPSSYTAALLASDANCPLSGGAPHVGFELRFDAVTGELLEQKPGIGCIVCLAP